MNYPQIIYEIILMEQKKTYLAAMLRRVLSQTVLDEVTLHVGEIEKDTEDVDKEGEPEGGGVACVMDGDATEDNTESHTDVPTGELRRVGCATFVVGGEVDEHGLHTWPDVSIAKSDDKGGTVVGQGSLKQGEEQIAEETDEDAVVDVLDHLSFSQRTCPDEPGEDETTAEDSKPYSCASCHVEYFFPIDGKIVGKHTVGQTDTYHHYPKAPPLEEEKAVEGKRVFVGDNFMGREMNGGIDGTTDASCYKGNEEDDIVIADGVINQQPDCWCDTGSEVVGKPIIADALSPPRGWKHIDGTSAVCHSDGSHRCTMHGADDGKECHGAGYEIASKEGKEKEVTHEKHDATRKAIDKVASNGTCQK